MTGQQLDNWSENVWYPTVISGFVNLYATYHFKNPKFYTTNKVAILFQSRNIFKANKNLLKYYSVLYSINIGYLLLSLCYIK